MIIIVATIIAIIFLAVVAGMIIEEELNERNEEMSANLVKQVANIDFMADLTKKERSEVDKIKKQNKELENTFEIIFQKEREKVTQNG